MPRRVVGWSGEVLITAGVVVLLFVLWQLWWTDVVAEQQQDRIVRSLTDDFAAGSGAATVGADEYPDLGDAEAFAVIRIPRFGADYARPVIQGVDRPVLALGVGHYTDTVGPGKVGNFSLAGHRTTYGRPFHDIDRLRAGDRVIVETKPTVYVYEVTGHEIVRPWQTEVIAPVPDEPGARPSQRLLTMTSCHPKYRATYRFVTHGRLVERIARADWHLADWTDVAGGRTTGGG